MVELTGPNLKLKFRSGRGGKSFRSKERTSPSKAKKYSASELKMRAEDGRLSREINSHIKVAVWLLPSMKRRKVVTYV